MNKPGKSIGNIVCDTLTFMSVVGLPMAKWLKTLVSLGESQLLLCHIARGGRVTKYSEHK